MASDSGVRIVRLGAADAALAREVFRLLAEVFDEPHGEMSDDHLHRLLTSGSFWAYAAVTGDEVAGGLTAHTLLMTSTQRAEVFLYDLAVRPSRQRRGIGRMLVRTLVADAAAAGIDTVFVPADNDDLHALAFYGSLGARSSAVTFFELGTARGAEA